VEIPGGNWTLTARREGIAHVFEAAGAVSRTLGPYGSKHTMANDTRMADDARMSSNVRLFGLPVDTGRWAFVLAGMLMNLCM
jgi:hypothetical protein